MTPPAPDRRPRFHHTPPAGWMNDPNGLVVVEGVWHLFFQANPAACDWGDIAWGHAMSRDLVTWTPLPVALAPYPAREPGATTLVFSGSVVAANPAGGLAGDLDGPELWAYYTAHERRGDEPLNESVGLARSNDGGRTWTRHEGNPLIDRGQVDFRDPKVFRHEPTGAWVLVIAGSAERCVHLYRSDDGLVWDEAGRFADPAEGSALWECPDLFEVPVRSGDEAADGASRWVLVVSGSHPAGPPFTGMTYWVGDFDGWMFHPDGAGPRPFEYGKDFFAGVTYHGLPAGAEPVMIGWASNWAYAKVTPAPGWRGAMALPRRLWLEDDGTGALALVQGPAHPVEAALAAAAGEPTVIEGGAVRKGAVPADGTAGRGSAEPVAPAGTGPEGSERPGGEGLEAAEVRFEVVAGSGPAWLRLMVGPDEWLEIGADAGGGAGGVGRVWVDRRHTGPGDAVDPLFPSLDEAPLPPSAGSEPVEVRVIVDHSIVEVFAAGGRTVLTELWFPSGRWRLEVSPGASAVLARLNSAERWLDA